MLEHLVPPSTIHRSPAFAPSTAPPPCPVYTGSMDIRTPPRVDEYASLAEWKQARALYFKNLPRRDRTPREVVRTETVEVPVEVVRVETVERIVNVPVEVERIVYVDREVRVEVPVELEPEPGDDVEIPDFLRYDPLREFIMTEQREGETDEATLQRLRDELLNYLSLESAGAHLSDYEEVRKRVLSANIKPAGG